MFIKDVLFAQYVYETSVEDYNSYFSQNKMVNVEKKEKGEKPKEEWDNQRDFYNTWERTFKKF